MVNYTLTMCLIICATHCLIAGDEYDWCRLVCPYSNNRRSAMCEYDHQTFTDDCGNFKLAMSPQKRKHILYMHNEYRNKFAEGRINKSWPESSNMRQFGWDVELEAVAIRWAEQCVDDNAFCPITKNFWYVGQNAIVFSDAKTQPDVNGTGAFTAWSREIEKVHEKPETLVRTYPGSANIGHFTQLIWAETNKIGCADIFFKREGAYITHYFCFYGIGGNFINEQIYSIGTPCTKCKEGTECNPDSRYPSLCALPGDSKQPVDIEGPSQDLIESGDFIGVDDAQKLSTSATLCLLVFLKNSIRIAI